MEIVSQRFSGWGGISFKFKRIRKAGFCWGGGQKKSQTKMDLEIHKNNSENYRHSFGLRFGCWASAFVLHFSFPPRPFRRIHRSHSICEGVILAIPFTLCRICCFSCLFHWMHLLHVVIKFMNQLLLLCSTSRVKCNSAHYPSQIH